MTQTVDIVVIGGGIAGISAAAALAEHTTVRLLEAETQLGQHATGRSAAVFILNYGNATLRALNALSYPALAGGLLGNSVLSPRGELLVATVQSLPALEAYLDGSEGVERITPDEARKMVPVLRRESLVAASYEEQALGIDVDQLLQGCLRLFKSRGGQVETNAPVQALEQTGDGWRIETPKGSIHAKIVVNAAGAWADKIAALAGVKPIGLQPMRRSAVIMPMPANLDAYKHWPLFASAAEDWYAKPEATGLMISPGDEDPVEAQDIYPDDMVLAEGLYRFEQMVDLPIVRPSHSWAGLRSFVPDRSPVCGFDQEATGFFWLAGQGGYGVQTSPALTALTVSLCTEQTTDFPADLTAALSPARFGSTVN
ncbi:NAD(P)/FAD-dependent oxidoreductase [Marivita sp.]|jgi:D-arginine dehydrogenase|uniref:NAD(P)/FAD-dependent oxidoreductase n=1 Tax=Marivita sp. TaxID=2003365 RepID=UPI003B59BA19